MKTKLGWYYVDGNRELTTDEDSNEGSFVEVDVPEELIAEWNAVRDNLARIEFVLWQEYHKVADLLPKSPEKYHRDCEDCGNWYTTEYKDSRFCSECVEDHL